MSLNPVATVRQLQNLDPRYNTIPEGDEELIIRVRKNRLTILHFFLSCVCKDSPYREYAREIVNMLQNGEIVDTET